MSIRIEHEVDKQELLDFANMVFSMSSESTDFGNLLPKAYAGHRYERLQHYVIKEADKIRALIDVYPGEIKLGKDTLKTAYIGTVSVHPNSRKKGYMIKLMQEIECELRANGYDLVMLDGSRHRYKNFGFEKAGTKFCFNISAHGLETFISKQSEINVSYEFQLLEMENEEADSDIWNESFDLYSKRNVMSRTKEDFSVVLQSWGASTYAVWENDQYAGYISVSEDERNIYEFEVTDVSHIPNMIAAFMDEFGLDELGLEAGTDESAKLDILNQMSDYYIMSMSHHIKVLNYERTLPFLLKWKEKYSNIKDGKLEIQLDGQSYILEKNKDIILCEKADNLAPKLKLTGMEFISIFTTTRYYLEEQKKDSQINHLPKGWFPLPFFLPEADAF